jgi:hypothetical protein
VSRTNTDIVPTVLKSARSTLPPDLAAQQAVVDEFSLATIDAFTSHRSSQSA